MENKQINEMTNEELLLRQQLELLAAVSKEDASVEELPQLTLAMVKIYKALAENKTIRVTPLWDGVELQHYLEEE